MSENNKTKIVILAAGKGTRMQSELPKVLMQVKGRSMIKHLMEAVQKSGVDEKPCVVVGYGKEQVVSELGDACDYAVQSEQLGTGHAVMAAKECATGAEYVMILQGDQPFITPETISNLAEKTKTSKAKITFATTEVENFDGWRKAFASFGRILRTDGKVTGIKECRDATCEEQDVREVNAGCYVFEATWLWSNLAKLKTKNSQKEYYITDLVQIAVEQGDKIETVNVKPEEALGANSKEELEILETFSI